MMAKVVPKLWNFDRLYEVVVGTGERNANLLEERQPVLREHHHWSNLRHLARRFRRW